MKAEAKRHVLSTVNNTACGGFNSRHENRTPQPSVASADAMKKKAGSQKPMAKACEESSCKKPIVKNTTYHFTMGL